MFRLNELRNGYVEIIFIIKGIIGVNGRGKKIYSFVWEFKKIYG